MTSPTTVEWDLAGSTLPGSVLRVDPATGSVLATITVGKGAFDIVVGFGSVWVPNQDDNTVVRIDAGTNEATCVGRERRAASRRWRSTSGP